MSYLLPNEYVQYGLSADTTDDWTATASALIDAHCRRTTLAVAQYTQSTRLIAGSQTVRLTHLPLAVVDDATSPLISVSVRYGVPRRGELEDLRSQIATAFSIPGSWSEIDIAAVDVDFTTGELTLPCNFLGIPFNEAKVTYNAGFAEIPPPVKSACAQIVRNAQATPALNVRSSRIDTLEMQYFSGSLIDESVKLLLRPYVAERVG
ncbi:MAG TPA: hypothetical protein VIM60_00850 [Edaphobacter sp.]